MVVSASVRSRVLSYMEAEWQRFQAAMEHCSDRDEDIHEILLGGLSYQLQAFSKWQERERAAAEGAVAGEEVV